MREQSLTLTYHELLGNCKIHMFFDILLQIPRIHCYNRDQHFSCSENKTNKSHYSCQNDRSPWYIELKFPGSVRQLKSTTTMKRPMTDAILPIEHEAIVLHIDPNAESANAETIGKCFATWGCSPQADQTWTLTGNTQNTLQLPPVVQKRTAIVSGNYHSLPESHTPYPLAPWTLTTMRT